MPRQHTNYVRNTYDFTGDFPQRLRRWKDGGGQRRSIPKPAYLKALPGQPVGKERLP